MKIANTRERNVAGRTSRTAGAASGLLSVRRSPVGAHCEYNERVVRSGYGKATSEGSPTVLDGEGPPPCRSGPTMHNESNLYLAAGPVQF